MATYRQFVAEPVDEADLTSSWITGRPRALKAVKKVLGASDYQAHAGSYTGGANAVYWLEIIDRRPDGLVVVSNITEGAKRKVENVQAALEPELLYPLLRGRDVNRWQAVPSAYILVVQDPEKRQGYDEAWLQVTYPKTYAYLKRFEADLLERRDRGIQGLIKKGAPFYSMFAIADHTLAPYKVVWREVASQLDAAVTEDMLSSNVGLKSVVPDHTLIIIGCNLRVEAYYLCALLNSSPSRFLVQNYIVLHPDTHVLKNVRIPRYDSNTPLHNQLAALAQQALSATPGDLDC